MNNDRVRERTLKERLINDQETQKEKRGERKRCMWVRRVNLVAILPHSLATTSVHDVTH